MYPKCDWWIHWEKNDPEPTIYPKCSHWFPGHLVLEQSFGCLVAEEVVSGGIGAGPPVVIAHNLQGLANFIVEPSGCFGGRGFARADVDRGFGHTVSENLNSMDERGFIFQDVREVPVSGEVPEKGLGPVIFLVIMEIEVGARGGRGGVEIPLPDEQVVIRAVVEILGDAKAGGARSSRGRDPEKVKDR